MLDLTCWPNHHYVGNALFQLCKNKRKGEEGEGWCLAVSSPLLTCPSPWSGHTEHVGPGGASGRALRRGLLLPLVPWPWPAAALGSGWVPGALQGPGFAPPPQNHLGLFPQGNTIGSLHSGLPAVRFLQILLPKSCSSTDSEDRLSTRNDSLWGRESRGESPLPSCLNHLPTCW